MATGQDRHLVALDLDGTVVHHDGSIDDEVSDAIRSLAAAGHEIVIATGRAVDATLPVVEQLRIRPSWVICCNGAVTLRRDPLAHRAYRTEYVETFDASEALRRIRSRLLTARFGLETEAGEFLYTEKIPAGTLPVRQRQVPFEELATTPATRVLVVSPDHALEDFLAIVDTMGLTRVTYAIGFTAWLDIAPEGVSKESALEVVRSRLGIERAQVFAAGDGNNDIQMLEWAGRHGDAVAMGQAGETVRAAASRVTAPIEEAGLASALRDRFPTILGR
ncbi:HAD-IIB family hydrolase [Leucobacter weissii]|uniref:HAD-IIB family hydrolase n=1 Tax=Leucobacter weissii TaxID=1983706 RepID=A0A939MKS5_9MICO|nr:HAD-IIB family hydrolase [Leucobacter weissii]MBO1900457.1 HAD-IIB family hydrolase [Leucobacter weissii]